MISYQNFSDLFTQPVPICIGTVYLYSSFNYIIAYLLCCRPVNYAVCKAFLGSE